MIDVKRNSQCPCGSGLKAKRCCKHLLTARNDKISAEFQQRNAYAEYQRSVKYGKTEPLTYDEWFYQENERKAQEATEHVR